MMRPIHLHCLLILHLMDNDLVALVFYAGEVDQDIPHDQTTGIKF